MQHQHNRARRIREAREKGRLNESPAEPSPEDDARDQTAPAKQQKHDDRRAPVSRIPVECSPGDSQNRDRPNEYQRPPARPSGKQDRMSRRHAGSDHQENGHDINAKHDSPHGTGPKQVIGSAHQQQQNRGNCHDGQTDRPDPVTTPQLNESVSQSRIDSRSHQMTDGTKWLAAEEQRRNVDLMDVTDDAHDRISAWSRARTGCRSVT